MNTKIFAVLAIVLIALAIVSSAYAPSVSTPSFHRLGGDCLADRAQGDIIVKSDWYCNPVRGDYIRSLPIMDTVDRQQTSNQIANPSNGSSSTVHTEIQPPTDNTPPVVVNPPTDKHTKHPNNGGGNGSELDSNGNDRDPNTNSHANGHD